MHCPTCHIPAVKRGVYHRPSDQKSVQRYLCRNCCRSFSRQTWQIDYRLRRRRESQIIFRLLCSGVSQRRCALIVGMHPSGIARRVGLFGKVAATNLAIYRQCRPQTCEVLIDELETFEHTKCKPLTVPIAVEEGSRKILALDVAQIAAKGHLATISKKKYGWRQCHRRRALDKVFSDLTDCTLPTATIKSDQSQHYPARVRKFFPRAKHVTTKGRRGCVVGQGELKRGGFDPLFTLNHSYAMFRDNLKTLTRRTWCTVKRPERLLHLLYMYAAFHNQYLDNPHRITLRALVVSN